MSAVVSPIMFGVTSEDPAEPVFIIGATDPAFFLFVKTWADDKLAAIKAGRAPLAEIEKVADAQRILLQAELWRDMRGKVAQEVAGAEPEAPVSSGTPDTASFPPDEPSELTKAVPTSSKKKGGTGKSKLETAVLKPVVPPAVAAKKPSGSRVKLSK